MRAALLWPVALLLGCDGSDDGAQQVQERIGDGSLGPSDLVTYAVLSVPEAQLLAWVPKAARLAGRPAYRAPNALPDWISRLEFDTLEFYDASDLSPQTGWVSVARAHGKVYVMAMTN